jgi:indolepyruvate ferredoxin oxidoreductase
VAEIAALPDVVRGYEEIKLGNVAAFRAQAGAMSANLAAMDRPRPLRELPMVQHVPAR